MRHGGYLSRHPSVLIVIAVAAAVAYCSFLLDLMITGPKELAAVVSDLQVPGSATSTLMRLGDVVSALLVLPLLPFVYAGLPRGRKSISVCAFTAIFALCTAMAAIITLPCMSGEVCTSTAQNIQRWVHDAFSSVSVLAVFLGSWIVGSVTRDRGPAWLHGAARGTFWVGGVLGTAAFGYFLVVDSTSWEVGVVQRFQLVTIAAWIVCLGIFAARHGSAGAHNNGGRRAPARAPRDS